MSNSSSTHKKAKAFSPRAESETFREQYSLADLLVVIILLLLLIVLGYATIKYDILSHDAYTTATRKYNATVVPVASGASSTTAAGVSIPNHSNYIHDSC